MVISIHWLDNDGGYYSTLYGQLSGLFIYGFYDKLLLIQMV